MAQIGLDLYLTGFTGKLIVVWKKATTPLTEEGRGDPLPFPVDTAVSGRLVAPNLSPEVYNFEFWQSSDGITLDTLIRGPWSIDASAFDGGIAKQYEYVVGRGHTNITEGTGTEVWADPLDGDTSITDERYAGVAKEDIEFVMRGTGKRRTDEWDVKSGGGINLVVPNEKFSDDDSIFVNVYQKVSSPGTGGTTTSSSTSEYTDVVIVTANQTVGATYKNKAVICNSSAAVTTLTFPAFNTMADQKMKFVTHGMTGNYLVLQFAGSDTIAFAGASRGQIQLSAGRMLEIMWKSNVAYVLSDIGNAGYDIRGNRMLVDDVKPHQRLLDGEIRQIADYPGIIEWMDSNLNAGSIITTRTAWNTDDNRHKFYLNTGAGEFSFPDDRNVHYRALKTFDGTNGYSGAYTPDKLQDHRHSQTLGTLPTTLFGRLLTGFLGGVQIGNYYRTGANTGTDLTSSPTKTDGSDFIAVSDETSVKAARQVAVINL